MNPNIKLQESNPDFPNPDFLANMVRNGITEEFIKQAEEFGIHLVDKDKLTTTQIRRIFGHIKKIENYDKSEKFIPQLLMLKPLLAYINIKNVKKNPKDNKYLFPIKNLKKVLEKAIDAVVEPKEENKENEEQSKLNRFRLFCKGFEAILAYHKASGGQE